MTAPSTSLAQPPASPTGITGEWQRYAGFMKWPTLPDSTAESVPEGTDEAVTPRRGAMRATLRMLLLDMAVMAVLIAMLGAASAAGFELPENVNNSLGFGLYAVLLVVVAAPLMEELIFRSWLNGHPAVLAAAATCAVGFGVMPFIVTQADPEGAQPVLMIIGPAIAIVAAPVAAITLLRKPVPRLFRRGFPVFFWLSSIGFALVHLANFTEGTLWILLPLVVPQLALGTMLGYLRVHYGLIPAIALHALHNGILFSLAMIGQAAQGAGAGAG